MTHSVNIVDSSPQMVTQAFKLDNAWWIDPRNTFTNQKNLLAFLKTSPCNRNYFNGEKLDRENDLSEYLASSTIMHAFSSSEYISQAIQSLLNGQFSQQQHLLYYSELRSALSLLARHGVGVVNYNNFMLTSKNKAKFWNYLGTPRNTKPWGTHVACWQALRDWAKTSSAAFFLSDNISYMGVSLSDYLALASLTPEPIASRWLLEWSLDLNTLNNDRTARNSASYNPNFAISELHTSDSYRKALNNLCLCWRIINSDSLELYLIYDALKISLEVTSQYTTSEILVKIKELMLANHVSSDLVDLLKSNNGDWVKFKELISSDSSQPYASQMLGRSVMLHLLSLKGIDDILKKTGLSEVYKLKLVSYLQENMNEDLELIHDRIEDIKDIIEDIEDADSHPIQVIKEKFEKEVQFSKFKIISSMHYPNAWKFLDK